LTFESSSSRTSGKNHCHCNSTYSM